MSLIVLPSVHAPAIDPDKLHEQGVVPTAPLCQRCGRQATFENPVGASPRKVWNPFDRDRLSRQFDFICAACREAMA